jgi:hypothetical protein
MLNTPLNEGTQLGKGPDSITRSANIMDTTLKQAQLYEVVDPHNSLPPPSGGGGPDFLMALGTVFFWIVFALNTAGLSYVILKVLNFLDPKK